MFFFRGGDLFFQRTCGVNERQRGRKKERADIVQMLSQTYGQRTEKNKAVYAGIT